VLTIDRTAVIDWYERNRARSRSIFDLIDPAAYYSRPIALRNPIVFYEGHLPAFSIISLLRRGLGRPPVDQRLEDLFARGIDPDSVDSAIPRSGAQTTWPSRDGVLMFADRADAAVVEALKGAEFQPDALEELERARPAMERAQALYTALEHEAMHQETLLYMWHRLPYDQKHKPAGVTYDLGDLSWLPSSGGKRTIRIPAGIATLGADRARVTFGWDNEFDEQQVQVAGFEIDIHNVTNAEFMEFVNAGGYAEKLLWSEADWEWLAQERLQHPNFWRRRGSEWLWRGMFEDIPLPPSWPVYVSQAEASAYARWKGRRLPTEAEYHRAAFGTPSGAERQFPWGDAPPDTSRGNFDFQSWEPVPAGSRPAGASAWGVHDLVGNGWE